VSNCPLTLKKNEATVALEKVVSNCPVTLKKNEATVALEKVVSNWKRMKP
jgi:hypothetical protein